MASRPHFPDNKDAERFDNVVRKTFTAWKEEIEVWKPDGKGLRARSRRSDPDGS